MLFLWREVLMLNVTPGVPAGGSHFETHLSAEKLHGLRKQLPGDEDLRLHRYSLKPGAGVPPAVMILPFNPQSAPIRISPAPGAS
jgi:hypothetical protein